MVRYDNRDIFLGGLNGTFGGYYHADILLAYPESCMARMRTFRAGTRMWPPLLETHNSPRLRCLRLEIWLFFPNYLFCAMSLRPRETSGNPDVGGGEEAGAARLAPAVL